ncbi:MAG: UPF0262 family protein [Asticcacaulis sp.]
MTAGAALPSDSQANAGFDPQDRISRIDIDPQSLASSSAEVEHERQVAIFDLIEKNAFQPVKGTGGPYALRLALEENRLIFDITGPAFNQAVILSLAPFRSVSRDYGLICASYYEALRNATPGQIEAIDMGRRGLHNDGADLVQQRLEGKVRMDRETARRLFTLIHALHQRG